MRARREQRSTAEGALSRMGNAFASLGMGPGLGISGSMGGDDDEAELAILRAITGATQVRHIDEASGAIVGEDGLPTEAVPGIDEGGADGDCAAHGSSSKEGGLFKKAGGGGGAAGGGHLAAQVAQMHQMMLGEKEERAAVRRELGEVRSELRELRGLLGGAALALRTGQR